MFHLLTLQGKMPIYDFYHTVLHVTDNTELMKPVASLFLFLFLFLTNTEFVTQHRYPEFHRVFRIWRNLSMLKRAGRGQDPAGANGTAQGELAVECPACPNPGRNIPQRWESGGVSLYISAVSL